MKENLALLHNHPSITTWVLFNEGWGAYDQERLARWLKQADPTRLVNGHSGPFDHVKVGQWLRTLPIPKLFSALGTDAAVADEFYAHQFRAPSDWLAGDIVDLHYYPGPKMFSARPDVASVTGEHGSFGVHIEGHVWSELTRVGRGLGASGLTPQQMLKAYADSTDRLKALEAEGLSGAAYFQLVDVENEHQGFLTYDRAISKVPVTGLAQLNARLVSRASNYAAATAGFSVADADATPESQRYRDLLAEFQSGRRDPTFLVRLALMASRQNDPERATDIAGAYLAQISPPYDKKTWETIVALTRTSNDKGFEVLRARAGEANAALGPQEAQKKMLDIIRREVVVPYFQEKQRAQDWDAFERSVAVTHGELGREAVRGARMMEYLRNEDWVGFGNAYALYFATATPRSPYLLHSLAYQVLAHVSDERALQAAVRVMQWQIEQPGEAAAVFGSYDPTELDTYAGLLHKVGRRAEALEWQQRAVTLSQGRDRKIVENLEKMISSCAAEACTSSPPADERLQSAP
jgi:hypothetical protein